LPAPSRRSPNASSSTSRPPRSTSSSRRRLLDLFRELQAETGVASLYISHDLALVSRIANRVAVIHRGRIVEVDPADQVFRAPRDAYTKALIASVPRPDRGWWRASLPPTRRRF
jgi:ABC-type oligopeptide transport system ATPase subunit